MVKLVLKNLKELKSGLDKEVKELCEEKVSFYNEYLKKYDKDLSLEVTFNKSSALYKVSASLNLKSKTVNLYKEGENLLAVVNALFSDFKKVVKKQYEHEKKEYEYKRKR